MELKITGLFYCLCDDFLISEGWSDAPQSTMSTAEIMTAAVLPPLSSPAVMKKAAAWIYACHAFKKPVQSPLGRDP